MVIDTDKHPSALKVSVEDRDKVMEALSGFYSIAIN